MRLCRGIAPRPVDARNAIRLRIRLAARRLRIQAPCHHFGDSASGFPWHLFAFLTRLGETYGNSLFAAFDLAAFAATAAFRATALIAMHFTLYILAGAPGVSALRLLCH